MGIEIKKHLVVLSGAGISAESGLKTFRDGDGLWEGHRVEDVATPEAWQRDRERVLRFYNERRRSVREAMPNKAHLMLARLETHFKVSIITQNIDDLHERGGSTNVLHLHGEIFKSRSTKNPALIYDTLGDVMPGDKCREGSQLRPHIVWFGEPVPAIEEAVRIVRTADLFLVIGTSLVVYPAAGLVNYVSGSARRYIIDPNLPETAIAQGFETFCCGASEGMHLFTQKLSEQYQH